LKEIFFLLSGEGMLALFGLGCCGRAPAGLVHSLGNKGSEDLEVLLR